MAKTTCIMIVGVGGQGTLLTSRILANVLLANGFDVKASEVHGMSQRGGSVVTFVKYGERVYSPVVDRGEADFILCFELLEAARWLSHLKTDGKMIINNRRISPMPVITGEAEYPTKIITKLSDAGAGILSVDALNLALEAGSAKAVNVVLIGLLSNLLEFPEEDWMRALDAEVKPKFLELNRRAFAIGRAFGK